MALGLEVAVPDSHLELEIQLLSSVGQLVLVAPSRGHKSSPGSACCSELPVLGGTREEQQLPPVGDPGLDCSPNPRQGLGLCAAFP